MTSASTGNARWLRPLAPILAGLLLCAGLAACSGDDDNRTYVEQPVETIYNNALDALAAADYKAAAKGFEEVDRQHPYSVWAAKAQLMAGFTNYQGNKYDEAIVALDRFIQLRPGNRDIPYAFYLKALCYYEQITDIGRDQRITEQALNALGDVVKRFPDSPYARDARLKIDLTVDHLGGKEIEVGRFYHRSKHYLAAINRYRQVVEKYQTTTHVPEALHRLVECYLALGVVNEARMAGAVLGHNFPGSDWYADAYFLLEGVDLRPARDQSSWLDRVWRSIF